MSVRLERFNLWEIIFDFGVFMFYFLFSFSVCVHDGVSYRLATDLVDLSIAMSIIIKQAEVSAEAMSAGLR